MIASFILPAICFIAAILTFAITKDPTTAWIIMLTGWVIRVYALLTEINESLKNDR